MNSALCALSILACLASRVATIQGADDVPKAEDIKIDSDPMQRYLLHAPPKPGPDPNDGWKVLVVMPGGSGDEGFEKFVGRIRQNALERGWIVAQIVAPKWDEKQEIIWPTEMNPHVGMKRSTEKLFDAVLDDLAKRRKIDPKHVVTLSWSSSGPAAYAIALQKKTRVTGSFVAMSVYKPDLLPPLKSAAGRAFYIYHSPQDAVCPLKMAEQARDELKKAGAIVEYVTYEGGHGWKGNVWGDMKKGLDWLANPPKKPLPEKPGKPVPKGKS